MKFRRLIAVGLLGAGMTLLPVATGVAGALPAANGNGNGNNGNGNGNNGNGNGNNGNGNGNKGCTPRGRNNTYPPGQCKQTTNASAVDPCGTLIVFSEGWAGLTNVDITVPGTTIHETALSDANGDAQKTINIPPQTKPGNYTVVSTGVLPNTTPLTQSSAVTINNKPCVLGETVTNTQTGTPTATPAASGTTTSGSSTLPFTGGAATTMLVTLALGLVAAGSVALMAARRRRTT